jgi:pimeloyl-ACP methyl ester carboxylesterase
VRVLPGLVTSDVSTTALRAFLKRQGYAVSGWGLGRNFGPRPGIQDGMLALLREMNESSGRKVSVIGWSLGGVYAREIARRRPDDVRLVITLGSPIRMQDPRQSRATRTYQRFSKRHIEGLGRRVTTGPHQSVPVPATSIYSKLDGIVSWRTCLDDVGPTSENVAVIGSHSGLGHNPAALWVIADRLAQPEGSWKPFVPPRGARRLFPAVSEPASAASPR